MLVVGHALGTTNVVCVVDLGTISAANEETVAQNVKLAT